MQCFSCFSSFRNNFKRNIQYPKRVKGSKRIRFKLSPSKWKEFSMGLNIFPHSNSINIILVHQTKKESKHFKSKKYFASKKFKFSFLLREKIDSGRKKRRKNLSNVPRRLPSAIS